MRRAAALIAVIVACAPVAFILTFLLSPFWSWLEAAYKIESIGHSGPSDWCFELIYFVILAAGLLTYWRVARRPR